MSTANNTTKYLKTKLLAEEVALIKIAVKAYKTKELTQAKRELLHKLEHKDMFITIWRKNKHFQEPRQMGLFKSAKIEVHKSKVKVGDSIFAIPADYKTHEFKPNVDFGLVCKDCGLPLSASVHTIHIDVTSETK